jgi:YD repeat-containing protein
MIRRRQEWIMRTLKFTTRLVFVVFTILLSMVLLCEIVPAETVTYTYDDLNRLTSAKYDNGQEIKYTYDEVGNIIIEDSKGPAVAGPQEQLSGT